MNAWADAKMRRPKLASGQIKPPLAEVMGRQFEWRIRYAGEDGVVGTPDDIQLVNDLHLPLNEEIVLSIKSQDVLHSFFLPNMRVKQDLVPGMKQFVWFQPTRAGVYDIVCAELCGWGHYKMRGRLTIEPREKFDAWLAQRYAEQNQATFTPQPVESE
jgi:cytochrome c oxidase subunit 2